VNYSGHDLSDSNKYSSLPPIFVTEGYVPFTENTTYEMAKKLREFTEDDFLILSGSAALAAMAIAILKETNGIKSVNVLLYDAKKNKYWPRRINGKIQLPE
jgi:hypothetical protein